MFRGESAPALHGIGGAISDRNKPENVVFRPATRADFSDFYDEVPGVSARAWVVEVDGEVKGVGGVYFQSGRAMAFSEFKDGLSKRLKVMGARKIMEIVCGCSCTVYAYEGPFLTAPKLLEKLGFEKIGSSKFWYWSANVGC